MNLYRQLTTTYSQLTTRPPGPHWPHALADLDSTVSAIRDDYPDPARSDSVLRQLITLGRHDGDAVTVALYALAPALSSRLVGAVTDEHRSNALTDLTFVLLDSPLDRPGLAHRLVNRAHNRTHKAAARVHQRGVVHPVTIVPHDPQRLTSHHDTATLDIAELAVDRVDLARFHDAVQRALGTGAITPTAWNAYRDHRLRRAVDPSAPTCDGTQRTTAIRATRQLQPLIDAYLHAA